MELRTLLFSIAAVLLAGVTADPDDPPAQLAGYASLRDARSAAQALAGWSASQRRSWWHHTYSSRYDERRYFAQWEGNLNRTIAWNKKSGITYWQGLAVDDFSVLTWSQLSGTYLMRGINPGAVEGSASAQALSSASPTTGRCKAGAVIPADWDWRSSGIGNRVPMIRPSQGKCGSCWAQAATAALESRAMIDGVNVGPNLSEQQLLDCVNAGNGYRSQGCQGGLAEEALDYASRFFEADEGSYARARGRGCKTQAAGVGGGVSLVSRPGWRRVASSAGQIKRAVYCEDPVLAYVQIDRNFAYYQGGIYPASACRAQTSKSTFNHAVVIVGYSSGIKPYWIIRNSWGSTWGQGGTADLGGYALMELTFDAVGPCGAYRYPLVPLATRKARPPVAPPPPPPPPPPGPEWVCTCSNEDVVIKQLASWDGQYTFGLQGNRNIVLSRKLATQTVVLWQSNTVVARPQAPLTLVLQQDGNLVGYEGPPGSRTPFWRSGTAGLGAGPYRLALQINQNAVLYDGNGRALWSTASGEPSSPFYKRNWVAVASSSTGNQLSAVVGFGAWWHSADSGRTWTSDGSQRDWADVAMSGDGSVQFAAVRGGSVYFTADSFASVFGAGDDLGKRQWSSIACSNDGTQFVVADKGGSLWTATVFLSNPALPGITPVEHTAAGSRKWVSVAMSADGQSILAAADGPGPLWASSDGGSTWREVTCPGNRAWTGVAIAGGFQVAVERGGLVWSNTAPGNGWSECGTWGDLGKRNWASVAAAPSGNDIVLAAAAAGGGIWTARIVVDSSAHDYRIDPDSISEGAARTEGAQPWSSVALASDSGAITAVAPFSFWGIFRSEDSSSQIWAPPMRGIRRFVFSNVTTSTFPQPRLPLEKNEVVPGFAPVVGKFMAQVFNGSLIVPVTGSYQIFLGSVDGSRLYLNGQLVLDNSGLHPMTFVDNNFTLGAGWYKLRLETIQWKDPGAVALEWQGVGTDGRRQAISADYLSPSQI